MLLRIYSSKKVGNESRRGKNYSESTVNYKINLLRVSSVLFTYLEIIAVIVIIAKNDGYHLDASSSIVIAIGLIMHFGCNFVFGIGYLCVVHKNRVRE